MGVRNTMVNDGYKSCGIAHFPYARDQEIAFWESKGCDIAIREIQCERLYAPGFPEMGSYLYTAWEIYAKENHG